MAERRDRLETWPTIHGYLRRRYRDCTLRTVMSWRKSRGLPVRNYSGKRGAHVFAIREELDAWIAKELGHRHPAEATLRKSEPAQLGAGQGLDRAGRRGLWAALAAGLVVLAILAGLARREKTSPEPIRVEVAENALRAFGSDNSILWEVPFPTLATETRLVGEGSALVRQVDLDGDGVKEILFNRSPQHLSEGSGSLQAREPDDGSLIWEFPYGEGFVTDDPRPGAHFGEALVYIVPVGKERMILTLARHENFHPMEVALVSFAGDLVSRYQHPGWIYSVEIADIDGDRRAEALLGGINNPGKGPGNPSLAVLDLPFGEGGSCGQFGNPYGPANCFERDYLLFPNPDVFERAGHGAAIKRIALQEDGDLLLVAEHARDGVRVFYDLSRDLTALRVAASDELRARHEGLWFEGRLDHQFDKAEEQALLQFVRFDTAPTSSSPEIRRLIGGPTQVQVANATPSPGSD